MANTTARELRRQLLELTNEEKDKITEKQIYESAEMKRYLRGLADSLMDGKGNTTSVTVYDDGPDGFTAGTNGKNTVINWRNHLISDYESPELRFGAFLGMFFHEKGHDIFHDFDLEKQAEAYISAGHLYGQYPDGLTDDEHRAMEEIVDAMEDPATRPIFTHLYSDLANCVDDQHDENKMMKTFGRTVTRDIMLTRSSLVAHLPLYEDAVKSIEDGASPLSVLFQQLLLLCRIGRVNYRNVNDLENPEYKEVLDRIAPHMEKAYRTDSMEEKYTELNYMVIALWPYIKDMLKNADEPEEMTLVPASEGEDADVKIAVSPAGTDGEDGERSGSGEDSEEPSGDTGSDPGTEKSEGTKVPAEPDGKSDGKEKSESGKDESPSAAGTEAKEESPKETAKEDAVKSVLSALDTAAASGVMSKPGEGCRSSASAIRARIESEPDDGEDPTEGIDPFSKASYCPIDEIRHSIAEKEAEKKAAALQEKTLDDMALTITQSEMNAGHPVHMYRKHCTESADDYKDRLTPLKPVINRMKRQVENALRDLMEGSVTKHRPMGITYDLRDAYRPDSLYFTSKKAPQDLPKTAICVLVDQSGSMAREDRIDMASTGAIVLYEFATALGIPTSVCGHSADGDGNVEFYVYTDFDNPGKDKYGIASMRALYDNRDGAALNVARTLLQCREEDVKILFIISDGEPCATGYYGDEAAEDVRSVCKACRNDGIEVIAAGIGDDREQVQSVYHDEQYLDIENMATIGQTLCSILKKKLLGMAT